MNARRGAEKAAAEFDVDVEFHVPKTGTAAEQRTIVEGLLTKGIKAIAISPSDAASAGRIPRRSRRARSRSSRKTAIFRRAASASAISAPTTTKPVARPANSSRKPCPKAAAS